MSGCASSEFSEYILKDQIDEATRLAEWFARLFGKDFYLEIQNNGLDIQKRCAEGAIDLAKKLCLPLVATCDAHYLCQGDADAHVGRERVQGPPARVDWTGALVAVQVTI